MNLFTVEIDYSEAQKILKLTDEDYAALRAGAPLLNLPEAKPTGYFSINDVLMTEKDIVDLLAFNVEVSIKKVRGLKYATEAVNSAHLGHFTPGSTTITNISVANHNLFCVNDVTWIEDACTESLQGMLGKGWRILAVCPSNDNRRPDYILGRNKND